MNKNQELFEKAPVSKAVAVMAIPTMISMLVVVIYNMADTFFIGQTNDPMKVAAVGIYGIGQSVWNRRQFCYFQGIGRTQTGESEAYFRILLLRFPWRWYFYGSGFHFRNGTDLKTDRRQ